MVGDAVLENTLELRGHHVETVHMCQAQWRQNLACANVRRETYRLTKQRVCGPCMVASSWDHTKRMALATDLLGALGGPCVRQLR